MANIEVPPEYAGLAITDLSREQLLQLLDENSEGGIKITFAGKGNARRLARAVRPRVTRSVAKLGVGSAAERSKNLVVEGDNLQAMATLYKERGHVNLILTDPPYNTGNDFRYNDRWDDDPNDSGLGEFVSADDGARHTKWMRFMWPRLQMMRSMLRPTGVLAICIDHRELFRLGQMLDELFGEANRIGIINWQKSYAPRNDNKHLSTATEYVLVYAKDLTLARTGLLERSAETVGSYKNPDDDPRGDWSPADSTAPGAATHPGMLYGIQNPFTGDIVYPAPGRCWIRERPKFKNYLEQWGSKYEDRDLRDQRGLALVVKGAELRDGVSPSNDQALKAASKAAIARWNEGSWPELFFRQGGVGGREIGHGLPRFKSYLEDVKKGVVATTFWADDDFEPIDDLGAVSWEHEQSGHSQAGQKELAAVVGRSHGFETVKPLALFKKVITLWCPPDGVVLDPFAGSGTTGQAILDLNEDTSTSRRFLLIEQGRPEKGDSYARTLLSERLSRVVSGDWANGKGGPRPGGFTFVSLGKKVDASALLRMERDEMVDTVIGSHFDATRRRGDQLMSVVTAGKKPFRYLVAQNADDEGFFLVWDGPDENTDFTEHVYEVCADEAAAAGLKTSPYHVYARLYRYQTEGVRFYQIPDRILADFGLDTRSEPFADDDDVP